MVVEQGLRERQPAIVPGLAGKDVERVACGDLFTIACCKGTIIILLLLYPLSSTVTVIERTSGVSLSS